MPIQSGLPKIRVRGTTRVPKILLADPEATKRDLTIPNAQAAKAERAGFNFDGPTHYYLYDEDDDAIEVPRNYRPDLDPELRRDHDYKVVESVLEDWGSGDKPYLGEDRVTLGPNEFQPYDQQPAFDALVAPPAWPYGRILALRPGGGKTCIAMKALCHRGVHTLWVTTSTVLVDQFYRDAKQWLGLDRDEIGHVQGANNRWGGYGLTVAMLHTLAAQDHSDEFYDQFELIIFDEGDVLAAPYFADIAPRFRGERWLLTGTPNRADGMDVLFKMHVGDACFTDLEFELDPTCHFVYTGVPRSKSVVRMGGWNQRLGARQLHYSGTANLLMQDEDRMSYLVDTVVNLARQGRKIIVLGESVEGLALTYTEAMLHAPELKHGLVHGKVAKKKRLAIIEESDVLWASTQLAYRGLDRKEFDTLVIATLASATESRWRQAAGRILRYCAGKQSPLIVVLVDEDLQELLGLCTKLARIFKRWGWPLSGEAEPMIKEQNRKRKANRR